MSQHSDTLPRNPVENRTKPDQRHRTQHPEREIDTISPQICLPFTNSRFLSISPVNSQEVKLSGAAAGTEGNQQALAWPPRRTVKMNWNKPSLPQATSTLNQPPKNQSLFFTTKAQSFFVNHKSPKSSCSLPDALASTQHTYVSICLLLGFFFFLHLFV